MGEPFNIKNQLKVNKCTYMDTVTINSKWAPFLDSQHHILGKINAMGTFFSTSHLCLQSKWLTVMEITDVLQRRMLPQHLFCPLDSRMVQRVQEQSTGCLCCDIRRCSKHCPNLRYLKTFFRYTNLKKYKRMLLKQKIALNCKLLLKWPILC